MSRRIKTKKDAIDLVNEQHLQHKGKWLTFEVAKEYQAKVRALGGVKQKFVLELMEEYGVTQLEAINILNGFHVADYVNKYYRIQNKIPLSIDDKAET